jgi:ribokinase
VSTGAAAGSLEAVVVGSANLDTALQVARLPASGETALASATSEAPGGKGANQAVALARLGRRAAFVGCLGADAPGDRLHAALTEAGVDTTWVRRSDAAPTGAAYVVVDGQAENLIVVAPGANALLDAGDVERARPALEEARIVLAQLEIPVDAVLAAVRMARGLVVLNPAPARPLPAELLDRVDVLVPNRGELGALAGEGRPETVDELAALAASTGVRTAVVTLGADGAVVVEDGRVTAHVPAAPAEALDTTAAGDSFCAALADALLDGRAPAEAARWATAAAACTVARRGAQPSLPTRSETEAVASARAQAGNDDRK